MFLAAPRKAVWTLAAPMMAGMLVHAAYVIVDTAFIGWIGEEALAGVTFVLPLLFVLFAVTNGVGTAVTALVAQAIGRQDHAEADRVASSAVMLSVTLGVGMAALGWASGPLLVRASGALGESRVAAGQYFQILTLAVPLFLLGGTLRAVLTGEGDAKTPMIIMAGATLINVGLDALLIVVLGLGVRGAALATVTAQIFSLLGFGYCLALRRRTMVRVRWSQLGFHRPLLKGLTVIGLPTAAGQLVMAAGLALNNRVISHFGQVAVAAYGAASKVDMTVAMPIMGLAGASVAVIGMFAGAGRPDLVRFVARYTFRWAITVAVVVGIAAFLASEPIMRIFIRRPEALAIGRTYLGFMVLAYPLMAFGMTSGRILQGLGYGLPSLVITSLRVLVVGVPVAYLAVYRFDAPIHAVWASMIIGGACANILAMIWIRKIVWKQDPTRRAQPAAGRSAAG